MSSAQPRIVNELPTTPETVDMAAAVVVEDGDLQVIESFYSTMVELGEEQTSQLVRRERRKGWRQTNIEVLSELVYLAAGSASKAHPVLRSNAIYNFIRPVFDSGPQGNLAAQNMVPGILEITKLVDALYNVSDAVGDIAQEMTEPEQRFHLLRQYGARLENADDETLMPRAGIWKVGLYLGQGPHVEDSQLSKLRSSAETGAFDVFLADEVFSDSEAAPEVRRIREFAWHMAGGADGWYDRLLERPDLYGHEVQQIIYERRMALLVDVDAVNDEIGTMFRLVAVGKGPHAIEERARIWQDLAYAEKLRKGGRAGRSALQRTMHDRSALKRPKSVQSNDPAEELEMAGELEEERQPMSVAEQVYDYRNEVPSNTTVEEAVAAYAGNDARLKEGLEASCEYIGLHYKSGGMVKGIKRIKSTSDIWEMKPQDAPGLGNKSTVLRRTRLIFTERDEQIQLIGIVHRDRLFKFIETLKPNR